MIKLFFRFAVLPVLGLALVQTSPGAAAARYTSPVSIEGAVTIGARQLIELAGGRADLVLIDSRIHEDHDDVYIEGSLHLVDGETSCASLAQVLPAMDTPVIFYCNGVNCDRSEGSGNCNRLWLHRGLLVPGRHRGMACQQVPADPVNTHAA